MNIDLVYLWCDGSQPQMLEKRLKAERELGIVRDEETNGKCRYVTTDELKFSLRSVDLYAPWIHRIFIIVDDDQILPDWLKIEGTKITIVRHSEIMPPEMMPLFNSMAISFRIPFIKGLSECFLYANDDMMIFRDISPEDFFTTEGHPIVYHSGARNKDGQKSQYHRLLINCENAVTEAFGVTEELSRAIGHWPHHNIQGFRKSHWLECHKLFHKQIEATCHSRFRADDNLEEWLVSCYALASGQGRTRFARDLKGEHGPANADSLTITDWNRFEELLYTYRPLMFCVNDNETITDQDRLAMKARLSRLFERESRRGIGDENAIKVSVIIPVYNEERYLRECLDSVLNQNLKEVEVICIDDESTDGSVEILQEYAAKDSRLRVLTQANQGPGAARNAGLDVATGEYITFLDADDRLTSLTHLKVALDYAMDNRLDVLVLASNKGPGGNGKWTDSGWLRRELVPSEKVFSPEAVGTSLFVFTVPGPCAKLFRREFLSANGLRFPSLKRSEDFPFVMSSFLRSEKIGVLDIPLCDYRRGVATSLESTKDETPCIFLEAAEWFSKAIDLPHQPEWVRQAFRISMVCRYAYNLKAVGTYCGFRQIAERFFEETDNLMQKEDSSLASYLRAHAELCQLRAVQGDDEAIIELCLAMQTRWRVEKAGREKCEWLQTERDEARQKCVKFRTERDEARQKYVKFRTERDEARQKSEKFRTERDAARAQLKKLKGLVDGLRETV